MISVKDTPLPIMNVLTRALADNRISSATTYRILAILAEHANEDGTIRPLSDGSVVTNPVILAEMLGGIYKDAIFRNYRHLQELGYIDWQKAARGMERKSGVTGRVRLLVSPVQ